MLLASEDIKQKQNERQRSFSPSVLAEAGCLVCRCGRGSCVYHSGEPVSRSFFYGLLLAVFFFFFFLWLVVLLFLIDVNNVCL